MRIRMMALVGALAMAACATTGNQDADAQAKGSAAQAGTQAGKAAEAPTRAKAVAMINEVDQQAASLLQDGKWTSLRNLMGGARAVLFFPSVNRAGFVVAGSSGVGMLMARRGDQWSDPVFVDFQAASIGYQAGVEQMEILTLAMSDRATGEVLKGSTMMGGTSSFTAGDKGIGGGISSGGMSSGLELISVSFSKGAAIGGAIQGAQTTLDDAYNTALYGKPVAAEDVLRRVPGRLAETASLRRRLNQAVRAAWYGQ